jgi:uncharacterized protein YbaA (DUF1428 family)
MHDKLIDIMKKEIRPKYVDGFVLAVPKSKINEYLRLARMCGKIWLEHGLWNISNVSVTILR